MYPTVAANTSRQDYAELSFPELLEALSGESPWPPAEPRRTLGDDVLMFGLGLLMTLVVSGLIRGCAVRVDHPSACLSVPGQNQCIADLS